MTSTVAQMIETFPNKTTIHRQQLAAGIEELLSCGEACTACADACLGEEMVTELAKCIHTCVDCADICHATARVLARQTASDVNVIRPLLEACVMACQSCGDECARHAAMHQHCRICAAQCRRCESACRDLLTAVL
jgi:hypothetical protein